MWKVLMAILADQLTFYAEKYHLLPDHHFGGCLGCTTTDAMHLLTYKILEYHHASTKKSDISASVYYIVIVRRR